MQTYAVAVFCGSQSGNNPRFVNDAVDLGVFMGKNHFHLIYGGGNKGLMGAVANAVMEHGGKVTGIIPELLIGWEQQHTGITDLQVVADMHARKKIMYEMCDIAIILPGGYGTLDELFEILTWNTLKIHLKKIIILNSAGFYDHLILHIQQMQESQFLYESWNQRITIAKTVEEVISFLDANKN